MMKKATILLVEDNPDLNEINRDALVKRGYAVWIAETIEQAGALLDERAVDLIVMDILMPDGSGLELCRRLRQNRSLPILFLSALGQSSQRVEGLKAGGDDYLSKPYHLEEFVARIEALLRRAGGQEPVIRLGGLTLHTVSRRALAGEEDALLSPKEFSLLEILAKTPGEFVATEKLYRAVWGLDTLEDVRTVREHMYRLRRKLGRAPSVMIEASRGKGYRLVQR